MNNTQRKSVQARTKVSTSSTKIADSSSQEIKKITLCLIDVKDLPLETLKTLSAFDVLTRESFTTLSNWCKNLTVPGKSHSFHELVLKHQTEMEYREKRDKEHPFRERGIKIWNPDPKVQYRENTAVIPINVSKHQYNRACRIIDTIIKAFKELNASCSVGGGNEDNINITLFNTSLSFEFVELKTKRRHFSKQELFQSLRPAYEELFDGRFQIDWSAGHAGYYYAPEKSKAIVLSYQDVKDMILEDQISVMLFELVRICCNNVLTSWIEHKVESIESEEEERKQHEKELAIQRLELEKERKAHYEMLISQLPKHAESWFNRSQLLNFADDLEGHLNNFQSEDTVLLKKYILILRENAENCNPIKGVLKEMRLLELTEEN